MLRLVWYQLPLFPGSEHESADTHPVLDSERDRRSGPQWLRSTLAYLDFASGHSWRSLTNPEHRWSPDRLWYLNGIRAIKSLQAGQVPASLSLVDKKSDDALRIAKLARESRGWLVEELLRANPSLTDRKILSRLQKVKLARMILAARDSQAAELEAIA